MTNAPSATRGALAKLLEENASIRAQYDHAEQQLKASHTAAKAEESARKRLDELIAAEAAAMTAWSSGDTRTSPAADIKGRLALEGELSAATTKAADARIAADPFLHAVRRLSDRMIQSGREIEIAKAAVLVEALEPVVSRIETSVLDIRAGLNQVLGAADFISKTARELGRLDTGNPDMEVARPLLGFAEKINARVHAVMADLLYATTRFPEGSRLSAFMSALSRDASAELRVA
jgi:hypothetical protein